MQRQNEFRSKLAPNSYVPHWVRASPKGYYRPQSTKLTYVLGISLIGDLSAKI